MAAENLLSELTPETPLPDALKLLIKVEIGKLGAISKDKRGIRDSDVIHDIRVSARRLQTILESIGEILPQKILNPGNAKIKEIIKALGKARENDVSIDMIRRYIKKTKKKSARSYRTALTLLIARLQKETNDHREEAFANSEVTDGISYLNTEYLNDVIILDKKSFKDIKYLDIRKSLAANGLLILPRFYDRVVRLGKIALGEHSKDGPEDLHKMRIKAKPLRYTMEFFRFAYGADFGKLIKEVKEFVELLGEIHDRDVILAQLADFLEEIELFNQNAEKDKLNIELVDKLVKKLSHEREDQFIKIKNTFERWINEDFRQKMIMSLTH